MSSLIEANFKRYCYWSSSKKKLPTIWYQNALLNYVQLNEYLNWFDVLITNSNIIKGSYEPPLIVVPYCESYELLTEARKDIIFSKLPVNNICTQLFYDNCWNDPFSDHIIPIPMFRIDDEKDEVIPLTQDEEWAKDVMMQLRTQCLIEKHPIIIPGKEIDSKFVNKLNLIESTNFIDVQLQSFVHRKKIHMKSSDMAIAFFVPDEVKSWYHIDDNKKIYCCQNTLDKRLLDNSFVSILPAIKYEHNIPKLYMKLSELQPVQVSQPETWYEEEYTLQINTDDNKTPEINPQIILQVLSPHNKFFGHYIELDLFIEDNGPISSNKKKRYFTGFGFHLDKKLKPHCVRKTFKFVLTPITLKKYSKTRTTTFTQDTDDEHKIHKCKEIDRKLIDRYNFLDWVMTKIQKNCEKVNKLQLEMILKFAYTLYKYDTIKLYNILDYLCVLIEEAVFDYDWFIEDLFNKTNGVLKYDESELLEHLLTNDMTEMFQFTLIILQDMFHISSVKCSKCFSRTPIDDIKKDLNKYNLWICGSDEFLGCCGETIFYPENDELTAKMNEIHKICTEKTAKLQAKYVNYHEKEFMKWPHVLSLAIIMNNFEEDDFMKYFWHFVEEPSNEWMTLKIFTILHHKRGIKTTMSFFDSKVNQIGFIYWSYPFKYISSINASTHHIKHAVDLSCSTDYVTLYKSEYIGLFNIVQPIKEANIENFVIVQSCNRKLSDIKIAVSLNSLQTTVIESYSGRPLQILSKLNDINTSKQLLFVGDLATSELYLVIPDRNNVISCYGFFHGSWKSNQFRFDASWLLKKHHSSLFLCTVTLLQAPYKTHPSLLTSPLTHLSAYRTQRVYSIDLNKHLRYYGQIHKDIVDGVVQVTYDEFIDATLLFPHPVLFLNNAEPDGILSLEADDVFYSPWKSIESEHYRYADVDSKYIDIDSLDSKYILATPSMSNHQKVLFYELHEKWNKEKYDTRRRNREFQFAVNYLRSKGVKLLISQTLPRDAAIKFIPKDKLLLKKKHEKTVLYNVTDASRCLHDIVCHIYEGDSRTNCQQCNKSIRTRQQCYSCDICKFYFCESCGEELEEKQYQTSISSSLFKKKTKIHFRQKFFKMADNAISIVKVPSIYHITWADDRICKIVLILFHKQSNEWICNLSTLGDARSICSNDCKHKPYTYQQLLDNPTASHLWFNIVVPACAASLIGGPIYSKYLNCITDEELFNQFTSKYGQKPKYHQKKKFKPGNKHLACVQIHHKKMVDDANDSSIKYHFNEQASSFASSLNPQAYVNHLEISDTNFFHSVLSMIICHKDPSIDYSFPGMLPGQDLLFADHDHYNPSPKPYVIEWFKSKPGGIVYPVENLNYQEWESLYQTKPSEYLKHTSLFYDKLQATNPMNKYLPSPISVNESTPNVFYIESTVFEEKANDNETDTSFNSIESSKWCLNLIKETRQLQSSQAFYLKKMPWLFNKQINSKQFNQLNQFQFNKFIHALIEEFNSLSSSTKILHSKYLYNLSKYSNININNIVNASWKFFLYENNNELGDNLNIHDLFYQLLNKLKLICPNCYNFASKCSCNMNE